MTSKIDFELLFDKSNNLLSNANSALSEVCKLLKTEVEHYNWVGFYFMNHKDRMLEVGPYAGAKTDHTRIPFGKGICGQVANSGNTFVVDDVHEQDNYLACSIETKAEIVIPIYDREELIGQLDIDSHYQDPFTEEDQKFLEKLCTLIGEHPEVYASHLPE